MNDEIHRVRLNAFIQFFSSRFIKKNYEQRHFFIHSEIYKIVQQKHSLKKLFTQSFLGLSIQKIIHVYRFFWDYSFLGLFIQENY